MSKVYEVMWKQSNTQLI